MDDHNARQCRSFSTLLVQTVLIWMAGLLILSSCTPVAGVIEPPQVPEAMQDIVLNVAPAELALTRADLVAGFQLASEQSTGTEYAALYLRPSALDPEASGGNTLLSVLTSVGVYTTTADAAQVYQKASSEATTQTIDEIALGSETATDIVIEEFAGAAEGANASEAYRVSYHLMEQSVFQYGHRFQSGNVVAYIVVGGIGNPDEPQHLLEDARNLAQRQIDKIAEASMQPASD